jgi:hypothetical protein
MAYCVILEPSGAALGAKAADAVRWGFVKEDRMRRV